MKEIPLTHGAFTIVDDEDYEALSSFHWYLASTRGFRYAKRYHRFPGRDGNIFMHRQILGLDDPSVLVDHIDRNGLNNQRSNLRTGSHLVNNKNRCADRNSTSRFVGVCWHKRDKVWQAQFGKTINGKVEQIYIGSFKLEEDAARARDAVAKSHNAELAYLNFP